jgi:hypothetical protein
VSALTAVIFSGATNAGVRLALRLSAFALSADRRLKAAGGGAVHAQLRTAPVRDAAVTSDLTNGIVNHVKLKSEPVPAVACNSQELHANAAGALRQSEYAQIADSHSEDMSGNVPHVLQLTGLASSVDEPSKAAKLSVIGAVAACEFAMIVAGLSRVLRASAAPARIPTARAQAVARRLKGTDADAFPALKLCESV